MLLHSKERHSDLHSFLLGQWLLAQEAHGDWFAVEHNSAVADNLSQKYGKTKMWLCVQHYVWILCQQCLELFDKKNCLHNCFVTIKVSLFSEAPLAGISVKHFLVLFALGDIFFRCVWNPVLGSLQEGRHLGHQGGSFGGHWHGDCHLCIMITHPPPSHHKHSHHLCSLDNDSSTQAPAQAVASWKK